MAKTIAVTIAGRAYRMACGEGEERRLQDLGRHVDQTLAKLRTEFGEIGDSRLVIMTAISVADELFEARRRITELEGQVAGHLASRSAADENRESLAEEMVSLLDAASDRIERIARGLRDAHDPRRRAGT